MKHTASRRFWTCHEALPQEVQALADRNFALLKIDPAHPSLHFKTLARGRLVSARVGLHHRALGQPTAERVHWFWIGSHGDYDKLIGA